MKGALRIGLIGLGVVGGEVARHLIENRNFLEAQAGRPLDIVACSARDKTKDRGVDLSACAWADSPQALAARDDIDVVVELMGGADGAAYEAARTALAAGRHLVTANKAMLARHWGDLFALSHKGGAQIKFEASVCGGVPVVKAMRESLAGNRISRVSGILNGTCNYILSTMETRSVDFAEALREAQTLGYAEADPTFDIDGIDAAHKLVVLAKLGIDAGAAFEDIRITGIRAVHLSDVLEARGQGRAIRLVASAGHDAQGRLVMDVAPQVLDGSHPLASVMGPMNAVTIEASPVEICTLIGPGAGAGPTASAVLADIIDLARNF